MMWRQDMRMVNRRDEEAKEDGWERGRISSSMGVKLEKAEEGR
jgi:hypothetical protein